MVDFVKYKVTIHIDLGFQGLQKEFINIKILKKKPKGKELTEQEKQLNREKSSVRESWEHTISGVNRYNPVKAFYSLHIKDLDYPFIVAVGLWNFYLMAA